jgi:hypothetical protein
MNEWNKNYHGKYNEIPIYCPGNECFPDSCPETVSLTAYIKKHLSHQDFKQFPKAPIH